MGAPTIDYNPHLGHKDTVIRSHMKLVHYVAKRFKWSLSTTTSYEDLIGEGTIGLIKAFHNYDPVRFDGRVTQFTTYAVPMIGWEIQKYLRDRGLAFSVPRSLYSLAGSILKNGLSDSTAGEVAARLGCSEEAATEAIRYLRSRDVVSLEKPAGEEGNTTIRDLIPYSEDDTRTFVVEFLRTLSKKERKLVNLRAAGYTQQEIGIKLRCSQMHISRMLAAVGNKLEKYHGSEVSDLAVGKLTKDKYFDLKHQDKSDLEIRNMFGIGEATLTRLKKEWGVAGLRRVAVRKEAESPPVATLNIDPAAAAPIPESGVQRLRDELEGIKPVLERLERENELLRALLKNYL